METGASLGACEGGTVEETIDGLGAVDELGLGSTPPQLGFEVGPIIHPFSFANLLESAKSILNWSFVAP